MQYIIPQRPLTTLVDLISYLERSFSNRSDPPVNYIFANNYFFTDFPAAPPMPVALPDSDGTGKTGYGDLAHRLMPLRYRWRAPLSVYGYAVKSIIDPLACLRMHNHYCWAVVPAYESRGYIEVIPELVAVNQHYKQCHFNASECYNALKAAAMDNVTMVRYADKLVANVVHQIRAIFNMSPTEFLKQFMS